MKRFAFALIAMIFMMMTGCQLTPSDTGNGGRGGNNNGNGQNDDDNNVDDNDDDGNQNTNIAGDDEICVEFGREYDRLGLMLESSRESRWDNDEARVEYDDDIVCGFIRVEERDWSTVKVQVQLDDGDGDDWASYNDDSNRCGWRPTRVWRNGDRVDEDDIESLPWDWMNGGDNPSDSEGCDGWIGGRGL